MDRKRIFEEKIAFEDNTSFKVFSPRLSHRFMWHYHPEIELVYVEAINGIRHVGRHIDGFVGSDLVLMGGNLPHLNFDYGIETEYHQIVIQLKDKLYREVLTSIPEFIDIRNLLAQSTLGVAFYGNTKQDVARQIKILQNKEGFEGLILLLDILRQLAGTDEKVVLNKKDTRIKPHAKDKLRMETVYNYVYTNYDKNPDVNEVANSVHLSTSAFCRYFKRQTGLTFTQFVNQYRINRAKTLLLKEKSVSEVCFLVGFESLSYFSKRFKRIVGETPSSFQKEIHQYYHH